MGQLLRSNVGVGLDTSRFLGSITVSTADVNEIVRYPETCLFWGNDSTVVEQYDNWGEAIKGHQIWAHSPSKVWEAVLAYLADRCKEEQEEI